MSVSKMPVAIPFRVVASARLTAMVLLPTPPLALLIAITLLTFGIERFSGKPNRAQLVFLIQYDTVTSYPVSFEPQCLAAFQRAEVPVTENQLHTARLTFPDVDAICNRTWKWSHVPAGSHGHQLLDARLYKVCVCQ